MAKAKIGGLGRGLDALIPSLETRKPAAAKTEEKRSPKTASAEEKKETPPAPAAPAEKAVAPDAKVRLSAIEPNRDQPRKEFDEALLQELADSMKQYGVIQPLIVRPKGKRYEIVAGERRWRAAKLAGLKEVPVLIRDYDDRTVSEIALIENLQREDLNPLDEAGAYRALMDTYGLTQEEVAERVGKARSGIANALRLLGLAEPVRQMVRAGTISAGHGKALLGLTEASLQEEAAQTVAKEGLNVRQTEALVRRLLAPKPAKKPEKAFTGEAAYRKLEETLKEKAGTRVQIRRKTEKSGRIEIDYYSVEDLERIAAFFTGK